MTIEDLSPAVQIVGIVIASVGALWVGTSRAFTGLKNSILRDIERRVGNLEREVGIDA